MTPPDGARTVALRSGLDLAATLGPLRHGAGDRTIALAPGSAWIAFRTSSGPATLNLRVSAASRLEAAAWGPGATAALDRVPQLVGEDDEPERLVARHRVIRELQRRHAGMRLPRSGRVFDALVPSIIEQRVISTEAYRSYAALLRVAGEPAPGPMRLRLHPTPEAVRGMPYHAYHPLGLERRRADVIRNAARHARWLDEAPTAAEATRRLRALPGVGAWTAAEVVRAAFGDPDAISLGDYHLPDTVAWALAREPRADDARMLELLTPYAGQRGRIQRLLDHARVAAPRYGPRVPFRNVAGS